MGNSTKVLSTTHPKYTTLIVLANDLKQVILDMDTDVKTTAYYLLAEQCTYIVESTVLIRPIKLLDVENITIGELLNIMSQTYYYKVENHLNQLATLYHILDKPNETSFETEIAEIFADDIELAKNVIEFIFNNQEMKLSDIIKEQILHE